MLFHRAQVQNLGFSCQPIPIRRENRLGIELLVMRRERRLIATFFMEMQGTVAHAFAKAKFDAARFGPGLLEDVSDCIARCIEMLQFRNDARDDI